MSVRRPVTVRRAVAALVLVLVALLGWPAAGGAVPPPPPPRVRLMVVGDLMLARQVDARIAREGVRAPFRAVQRILARLGA